MNKLRLLEKIGEGSYSQVFKAFDEVAQRTVAVKVISFADAPQAYIQSR